MKTYLDKRAGMLKIYSKKKIVGEASIEFLQEFLSNVYGKRIAFTDYENGSGTQFNTKRVFEVID